MFVQPVTAPRVKALVDPPPDVAEALHRTVLTPGQSPLNIFSTLAVHPRLLVRLNQLTGTLIHRGTLPARERELVIMRVAARVQCQYEWRQHERLALEAGLTEQQIAAISSERPHEAISAEDAELLNVTDELLATDDVHDETWAAVARRYSDEQLVELIVLVGCYRMMALVMRTLRVTVDD